jgi:RimJ/RimL family protein N-acetyltransferase
VSFDFQPTLVGELIELRPLRAGDFDDLYAVASDPLIWKQHPESNRHELPVFRDFFRESLASGGALVAIDPKTRQIIGASRFHGYNKERSEIEIGWTFLARAYWGGTYNGAMKQLMLQHAFRFVDSVVFLVGPYNLRSQRALEKIGGVRIASRLNGKGRVCVVYEIAASNFAQREQNRKPV